MARLACAVTLGCGEIGAEVNGSHLMAWSAQFFTGKQEQRVIHEYLQQFMNKTKWPTGTSLERLVQLWQGKRHSWKAP